MPKLRDTIPTLLSLSLKHIKQQLKDILYSRMITTEQMRDFVATIMNSVYAYNVPYLSNELTESLWNHVQYCSLEKRDAINEFCFNKHVKQFDQELLQRSDIIEYVNEQLIKLVNLELLKIKIVSEEILMTSLGFMKKLHTIILFDKCTDQVLKVIADNLAGTLRVLNIQQSIKVSDASVAHIIQLKKLTELNLLYAGISPEGVAEILENLPELRDFECGYELIYIFTVYNIIKPLSLKVVQIANTHSVINTSMFVQLCPLMEQLYFKYIAEENLGYLDCLTELKKLNHLNFVKCKFLFVEPVLKIIGRKITHLELYFVENLNLVRVHELCPYLTNLSVVNCTMCKIESLHVPQNYFTDVTDLSWVILQDEHINCNLNELQPVLDHVQSVVNLNLKFSCIMDESYFEEVFIVNPMYKLENFNISCVDSSEDIQKFVQAIVLSRTMQ